VNVEAHIAQRLEVAKLFVDVSDFDALDSVLVSI
jgi:hypothetical protein